MDDKGSNKYAFLFEGITTDRDEFGEIEVRWRDHAKRFPWSEGTDRDIDKSVRELLESYHEPGAASPRPTGIQAVDKDGKLVAHYRWTSKGAQQVLSRHPPRSISK